MASSATQPASSWIDNTKHIYQPSLLALMQVQQPHASVDNLLLTINYSFATTSTLKCGTVSQEELRRLSGTPLSISGLSTDLQVRAPSSPPSHADLSYTFFVKCYASNSTLPVFIVASKCVATPSSTSFVIVTNMLLSRAGRAAQARSPCPRGSFVGGGVTPMKCPLSFNFTEALRNMFAISLPLDA